MNMVSRSEQKSATRARILEVARAQLEREGFEGTNIRAIAAEAGVASGTVLMHFRDKSDLLHAALFDDLEAAWQSAKRLRTEGGLEPQLSAIAQAFFAYYAARPALSRALLRESLFAEPPWRERFASQIAEVHAHVAARASEAVAQGELDEQTDPSLLGASFFSFYYFALLAWLQGGHPEPLRLFRSLMAQQLSGLRPARRSP